MTAFARLLASVRSALAANDRAWRGAPAQPAQVGFAEVDWRDYVVVDRVWLAADGSTVHAPGFPKREAQREGSVASA